MDNETKQVMSDQHLLRDLVGHAGWRVARQILTDKILNLQDAFQVEEADPQKMFMDLGARKMASMILFTWLSELEGAKEVAEFEKPPVDKSYILKV